jgi:hypothetical protein
VTIRPHGMAGGEGEVTARAELQRQRHRTDKIHRNPSISTCRVSCTPRARLRLEGDDLLLSLVQLMVQDTGMRSDIAVQPAIQNIAATVGPRRDCSEALFRLVGEPRRAWR